MIELKEKFRTLLERSDFTTDDVEFLDRLIKKYPWFGHARFMKLRVLEKLNMKPEQSEVRNAAVFTGDRKQLYHFVKGDDGQSSIDKELSGKELEFIDDDSLSEVNDIELTDNDDDHSDSDMDSKIISQKDETEMEDPEIDQVEGLPVIDTLEDEEDDNREEEPDAMAKAPDHTEIDLTEVPEQGNAENEKTEIRQDYSEPGLKEKRSEDPEAMKLIHEFLENDPGVIKADKEPSLTGDVSEDSVKEDDDFITNTLAKIYVKQGLYAKAIYAYEKLSLKYPEKSAYFAAQIEKIKIISNL